MGIELEVPAPWWLVVTLSLAALIFKFFFSRSAVIKRRLRRSGRVPIKNFPDGGMAKIVGRLDYAGKPLKAPLTGRRCAQYVVEVEEQGDSGEWHRLTKEEDRRDFFLDDGTGEALVKLQGARIAVTKDRKYRSGPFKDATPLLEGFLSSHSQKSTGLLGFNKRLRYQEGVLRKGEDVAVYGVGRWEKDADGRQERLVLESTWRVPLYVSDDPDLIRDSYTTPEREGRES